MVGNHEAVRIVALPDKFRGTATAAEVAGAVADLVIVERGIAPTDRFQPVIKIEHDFVERQFIDNLRAAPDIGKLFLDTAPVLT